MHSVSTLELDHCYSAFGAQIVLRDRSNSAEGRPNALLTETPDYFHEAYPNPPATYYIGPQGLWYPI